MGTRNPENVLLRVGEDVGVGLYEAAIDRILFMLKNARQSTWNPALEEVMLKFVRLCVDCNMTRVAREGLQEYRHLVETSNPDSLNKVLHSFLDSAEEKYDEEMMNLTGEDSKDVEGGMVMSGAGGVARGFEQTSEWLYFTREAYKVVLDLLRVSTKHEDMYRQASERAFAFCKRSMRKKELRRVCETLRDHLQRLQSVDRTRDLPEFYPDLHRKESFDVHLQIRFSLLDTTHELEMWQEAFRTVEDIYSLIRYYKGNIKTTQMQNFYRRLLKLLWVSQHYVFHAYISVKLFKLLKGWKISDNNVLSVAAEETLLAVMAIPILKEGIEVGPQYEMREVQEEKKIRLARILGSPSVPSRISLIQSLVAEGVLNYVSQPLRTVFRLMEKEFDPFSLPQSLISFQESMSNSDIWKHYVIDALEENILVRFVQQMGEVYDTITFDTLKEYTEVFGSREEIERILVVSNLKITFDHSMECVYFNEDSRSVDAVRIGIERVVSEMDEIVREMYLDEDMSTANEMKKKFFSTARDTLESSNKEIHERMVRIEHNKSVVENLKNKSEREKMDRVNQQRAEEQDKIRQRIVDQHDKREKAKKEQAHREMKLQEYKQFISDIEKKKGVKISLGEDLEQNPSVVLEMDTETLLQESQKQITDNRMEKEKKIMKEQKRLNYYIRALREEEFPLIDDWGSKWEESYKEKHQNYILQQEINHKKLYDIDLAEKQRVAKVFDDKDEFVKKLMGIREEEFETAVQEQEERRKERYEVWVENKAGRKDVMEAQRRQEEEERRKHMLELEERKSREEEMRRVEDERQAMEMAQQAMSVSRADAVSNWRAGGKPSQPTTQVAQSVGGSKWKKGGDAIPWKKTREVEERAPEADSGDWRRPNPRRMEERYPPRMEENRDRFPRRMEDSRERYPPRMDDDRDRFPRRMDDDRDRFPRRMEDSRERYPPRMEENRDRIPPRMEENRDRIPPRMEENRDRIPPREENRDIIPPREETREDEEGEERPRGSYVPPGRRNPGRDGEGGGWTSVSARRGGWRKG